MIPCKHPGKTNNPHSCTIYNLHNISSERSGSDEDPPSPTRSPRRKQRRAARQRGAARWRGRGRGAGRLRSHGGSGVRGRGGRGHGRGGHSQNARDKSPWSSRTAAVTVEPFNRSVGPTVALSACILVIFKLFLTPALIDLIVEQTNLCVSQMSADQYAKWEEVTVEEICAYMGFMILMGINHLPALSDYWKLDPTYHYGAIADKITRDRFFDISWYLHFVDNTTLIPWSDPGYDKLGKVRPVIRILSEQFLQNYNPHCENSIDEAMIKFKGRSSMKQYLPKKPVKRGFKVWVRADGVNSYVCEFEVYTGKTEKRS